MYKVVVGLSGGVDSSVAAHLLKEQGYEVIGLFMKNWHDDTVTRSDECPWLEDSNDAMIVAEKLGIPFQTVDLSDIYKERVVKYMFSEYEKGRTPNPDVLCNREIKFDVFLSIALQLGADYVATGHYCRKKTYDNHGKISYRLLAGKDKNKDQSYFLCQLNQNQLAKALFPIGELTKPEVRRIAATKGLITADKKDSQGLCFVGKVRLPEFLQQQLKPKEGLIVEVSPNHGQYRKIQNPVFDSKKDAFRFFSKKYTYHVDDGKIVGHHQGAHYFTKGQRKGLNVGGTAHPLFVIATDVEENIIYTGQGKDHPGLYRKTIFIIEEDIHWVREDMALDIDQDMQVTVRIRYRQALQKGLLYKVDSGMYIDFEIPQRGIAEGQFAVWYLDDELIGSGIIS